MSDNVKASTDPTLACDDIGPGVIYPRVKIALGADNAWDGDLDPGQVAAASSLPVVLASDQVPLSTDLKVAKGRATSSGDNTALAAVSSKKFRVYGFSLQAEGTVEAVFQDATSGDVSEKWVFQAREGVVKTVPFPGFLFETANANTILQLNLSAAVAVNWWLLYREF